MARRLLLWLETAVYGSAAALSALSGEQHATEDDPLASPVSVPAEARESASDPWVERRLPLLSTPAVPAVPPATPTR